MSGRGRDFAEGVSADGDWTWLFVVIGFFVIFFAVEKFNEWVEGRKK